MQIPKYMEDVFIQRVRDKDRPRIAEVGLYRYRIDGYNSIRPAYGIYADIEKLQRWCNAHICNNIENIVFHEERKNYYVEFSMYDPMVQQLENAGLIRRR